jgi:SAM-dependent methyltransferase
MAIIRRAVDRVLALPIVYATWQAPFSDQKFRPVNDWLAAHPARRVLDVGCGPGTNAPRFANVDYVGLDINEHYLSIARSKYRGTFIQADLSSANLAELGEFDTVLINSVLHHLSDQTVDRILQQAATRLGPDGSIHVLELVLPSRLSLATVMAHLDRGRFARPLAAWRTLLGRHLQELAFEPYSFGGGLWSMVYFRGRVPR